MKKKPNKANTPLDQLPESKLIDLIVTLGVFSNLCIKKTESEQKLPFNVVLLSCLKLYDMNLLQITKHDNGEYSISYSEIPTHLIQHLVSIDGTKDFLPQKVIFLVSKFVELSEEEDIFNHE